MSGQHRFERFKARVAGVHARPDAGDSGISHLLARARSLHVDAIPDLLGEVEALRAALWTRLQSPALAPEARSESGPREEASLLRPEDAARLMGVTVRWLYRHHRQLPFARKLSRKALRFSEPGLRRWVATRKA